MEPHGGRVPNSVASSSIFDALPALIRSSTASSIIPLVGRIVLLLCLLSAASMAQAADLSGSRDPLDIARMPYSWIVGYDMDESLRPREYALGRVDKSRRDVRIDHEVRASATREWATYEMPAGTQPRDVIDHYLRVLDIEPLFTCRGRDCGRSNLWANEIFKQANLLGPDRNQFYFAAELGRALIALYVIERGNKRVYAHLEILQPEDKVALSLNDVVLEDLAGRGRAVVEGVTPDRQGNFDSVELELLADFQAGLTVFQSQTVFVVCHLYGSESGPALIERSKTCAQAAVQALGGPNGPELVPFGAGPLLPRTGFGSRIELVLPHRLSH